MKLRCAYSGLHLEVSHFPGTLPDRLCYHPVFALPQKGLIQYIRKWGDAELTSQDSYLLFLALLNSTEKIEFRCAAQFIPGKTEQIVSNNLESLARIISYTNTIVHPSFQLPSIAITKETCNLSNARIWIQDWWDCFNAFQEGGIQEREIQKLKQREALLQTFIKNVNKPISHYAKILADWAAEAGEFPTFPVALAGSGVTSCSEYWKGIIIKCCKSEAIFSILASDLEELIQHCEDNIEHGSIYAHTLMELLRAGQKRQQNYLGLGDVDLDTTTYRIISEDTSVEDAAKMAMIDSAPTEKPMEGNYPSKIAFLRAKLKWDMKQDWLLQLATATAIQGNTTEATLPDGEIL